MIVGTAGHIDHGKTTLVKALTGVDCDRLKEEKARGITLDLGYAYADGGTLGFVDVPGHERLVHNMLAGATGIDFVLLVVAADDGPMPQTREHLAIVSLLGLTRGAVALTKVDVVAPERRAAAHAEVAALLAEFALGSFPVDEVSAQTGEGVDALHTALAAAAAQTPTPASDGGFRLAIDRCFTLPGVGVVVTGAAHAGQVRVGDTVCLSPPGRKLRVRGLHAQDKPSETGHAGQRLAINLAGDLEKNEVSRGMWVLAPDLHLPVQRVQGRLRLLAGEAAPLKHWTSVHCHLGAEDVLARVALLEGESLAPGDDMFVELLLERPVGALRGDRFILRDQCATRSLGGGVLLDVLPPTRHKRKPERLAYLAALAESDPAPALALALTQRPSGVDLTAETRQANWPEARAEALWQSLDLVVVAEGERRVGFAREVWTTLGERVIAAAAAEHERAPDMPGVERDRLRRLSAPGLSRVVFDRLLSELTDLGALETQGAWLRLPGHRAELSATDREFWLTLKPLIDAAPYNPPRVRDIARSTGVAEDRVRRMLKSVARVGEVYPVAHDHYFSAVAVSDLAARVASLHHAQGAARAAPLRDEIGGGRKVAIHILEFFDRVGYTRRVRDDHLLRDAEPRQW
ncbi:MAG: selenocysteine-specific translation elongation factor [Betaproteobacteria bacterium]|nr:selenocysteine-specific translation elongation factor [Betaproteobacteria bacterium]